MSSRIVMDVQKHPTMTELIFDASEPPFLNSKVTALTVLVLCFIVPVDDAGVNAAALVPSPNKGKQDFKTAVGVPRIVKVTSYIIVSGLWCP